MNENPQDRQFAETLEAMAECLNRHRVQWMIINGAAMVLHGFEPGPPKDIDVILGSQDAARLAAGMAWENHADGMSDRFRSDVVLKPDFGPVPVELLGGFQIRAGDSWVGVECRDAQEMLLGRQVVFIPRLAKLAEILRLCGREKDLRRVALIEER